MRKVIYSLYIISNLILGYLGFLLILALILSTGGGEGALIRFAPLPLLEILIPLIIIILGLTLLPYIVYRITRNRRLIVMAYTAFFVSMIILSPIYFFIFT